MKTPEMEMALYRKLSANEKIICPNISWGIGINHECDLFIVDKNNFVTEIEIKVSKSDLKKDATKGHKHASNKIKYLYFAIPQEMDRKDCLELIPDHAGIYVVSKKEVGSISNPFSIVKVDKKRMAKPNPTAKELEPKDIRKLSYLMQFRFWRERIRANNLNEQLKNKNQIKLKI